MYRALLTSDEKEMMPIFVNLKMMIPVAFNQFMLKVWRGDRDAIIKFIIQFFEVNKQIFKEWKNISGFDYETEERKARFRYL